MWGFFRGGNIRTMSILFLRYKGFTDQSGSDFCSTGLHYGIGGGGGDGGGGGTAPPHGGRYETLAAAATTAASTRERVGK